MEGNWRRFRFLRKPKRSLKRAGHVAVNVTFALALVTLSYAPIFGSLPGPVGERLAPQTASAKNLEWGDMRPPLTDEADSTDTDGFQHLPDYGRALHATVVAPNGDLFTGGTGAEVDANGDGACGAITPTVALTPNLTASSAQGLVLDSTSSAGTGLTAAASAVSGTVTTTGCDAAAVVAPVVFKSVDGGTKWRSARLLGALPGAAAGTTIRQIVVSPDYPSDNFVAVVFSTLVAGDVATAANGICWSTDGGLTFAAASCRTGAAFATDTDLDDVSWQTIALSPDFNFNDSSGEVAIGGVSIGATPSTATASATALKAALAATTLNDITDAGAAAGDNTLHLSYTYDEEPIALARIVVDVSAAKTFGQVRSAAAWTDYTASLGEEIKDDDTTSFSATSGQVAFDDDYAAGGSFFAAAGAGTTVGGVFRWSGSAWAEKTLSRVTCDSSTDSLTVAGNGSATRIVASLTPTAADPARVCRSTNEGSSWSDSNADGGDGVCDQCRVDATTAQVTRVANNRKNPEITYYTHSGPRGGLIKSTNTGSNWMDTGLTNEAYVAGVITTVDATKAFATATVPTGQVGAALDAFFYSDTYGTGAGWMRVMRYDSTDLAIVDPATDFTTAGVIFAYRSTATTDPILRSSDSGRTWDNTSADPFESSKESNEVVGGVPSHRSSTTLFVGGSLGSVSMTADGGSSWTILDKDFGNDIDEFDFKSLTVFFVTAEDSDTTNKVWLTTDGGKTFTQVGDAPWGTGDGGMTFSITGVSADAKSGTALMMTNGAATTDEVYRIKMGDSNWTDLDMDVEWTGMLQTAAAGVGDGTMVTLWNTVASTTAYTGLLMLTFYSDTGNVDDYNPTDAADNERKNLLLALPNPPVLGGTMGTNRSLPGYGLRTTRGGRVMELTLTDALRAGPKQVSPLDKSTTTTNVGDNGVPVIFRWDDISNVDSYEMLIGLNPSLTDGTVLGTGVSTADPTITTNLAIVAQGRFPLIQGVTYYWQVRVKTAEGATLEGPWSRIWSFSVGQPGGTISTPEPQLPLDGSTLPSLGTQVSWNNPAGTTQYQVQVRPLNDDGPAINLIISDPDLVRSASYTVEAPKFGTGNYVMLPGATYTWRARTSTATTSIGQTDPSWGPWSSVRSFKTPRPNSGTLQLVSPIAGAVVTTKKPVLSWRDANEQMFYYEVQLSSDPNFGGGPQGPIAAVQYQLVHGGVANPPNTYTSAVDLAPGTYYWRIRQRVQATALGPDEPGIAWTASQSFKVQ